MVLFFIESSAKSYSMSLFERAMQHYVTDYKPAITVAGRWRRRFISC
jgi:hypothetical protein